jgi:hypothetical protein
MGHCARLTDTAESRYGSSETEIEIAAVLRLISFGRNRRDRTRSRPALTGGFLPAQTWDVRLKRSLIFGRAWLNLSSGVDRAPKSAASGYSVRRPAM